MGDRNAENEEAGRITDRLERMSAVGLAAEARADFAYAEATARGKENQMYWLARAATHAGLAAYKAVQEADILQPPPTEPTEADQVLLVEATEATAVLRSPTTGNLYGISLDTSPDGEEVNVTELEELLSSEQ